MAKRSLTSVQIPAGSFKVQSIDLTKLPIQGVSYSSLAIVELAVDRGTDTIQVTSQPFHYPFSANYSTISVYNFDTMDAQLDGGQLTNDAFDLRGRVWNGSAYVDIDTLRAQEGAPADWTGSINFTDLGPPPQPDSPPVTGNLEICFNWRTKYIDARPSLGDDRVTTEIDQNLRAARTFVHITRVISTPCDALTSGDPCLSSVWQGYLSDIGCVYVQNGIAGAHYIAFIFSWFQLDRPGQPYPFKGDVYYVDPNDVVLGHVAWRVPFQPSSIQPPPWSILANMPFNTVSNATAALSQQLALPDLPPVDNVLPPNPDIVVYAHRRKIINPGESADNARAINNQVYTGDWVRHDTNKPGGLQFKSVLAHEYGHVYQFNGCGYWNNPYDVNATQLLCKCDHVDGANKAHCLQSREDIGAAQTEGLAHFFSAKTWNIPTQSNCWFVYYKDFKPTSGSVVNPPLSRDCYNPIEWRNTNCFEAIRGTEYDWLHFYWNINNRGTATTKVSDLWPIYQAACGGNCVLQPGVPWPTLESAAQAYFTAQSKPANFAHFQSWGGLAGVNQLP